MSSLSNGARVILKKTDFKDNEVMMQAEAKGGASLFVDTDPINVDFASTVAMFSGLGNFTKSELDKALAGKQASVSLSIDEDRQYISGRSTPKDLETLFQLTYLTMTNINKDEKSVAAFINQAKTVFGNKSLNHDLVFKDSVESTLHCGNRFYVTPEAEELSQFDYDRTLQILKQLYGHGGQFIYTIIGNFDEQQIRTLIEQYIASLPGGSRDFGHVRDIRTFFKGEKVNQFSKKMETPQAQVREIWLNEDMAYTLENKVMLNAVSQVLTRVYERTIREEESAVYGVGAGGRIDLNGSRPVFILNAAAPTNPDKMQIARDLMVKFVAEATQKIADEDLNAVKEIMLKQAQDNALLNVRLPSEKPYSPPKEWAALEDPANGITFASGQQFDFFWLGEWPDDAPISDDDYTEGFYDYMNKRYDHVFAVSSVNGPFTVIPHLEVTGK